MQSFDCTPLQMQVLLYNRPFQSDLGPLFQNESSCKTFHMKISFALMKMNLQAYEWFSTRTPFDTEAKANSEMTYYDVSKNFMFYSGK